MPSLLLLMAHLQPVYELVGVGSGVQFKSAFSPPQYVFQPAEAGPSQIMHVVPATTFDTTEDIEQRDRLKKGCGALIPKVWALIQLAVVVAAAIGAIVLTRWNLDLMFIVILLPGGLLSACYIFLAVAGFSRSNGCLCGAFFVWVIVAVVNGLGTLTLVVLYVLFNRYAFSYWPLLLPLFAHGVLATVMSGLADRHSGWDCGTGRVRADRL